MANIDDSGVVGGRLSHEYAAFKTRAETALSERRLEDAHQLLQQAEEVLVREVGCDHPDVVQLLNQRACILRDLGRFDEALRLFQSVGSLFVVTADEDSADIALSLHNQAVTLHAMGGRDNEALEMYTRAEEMCVRAFGAEHHYVATSLNNHARLLQTMGNYDDALIKLKLVQELKTKAFGASHIEVATVMNARAAIYQAMGPSKYDEALPLFEKAEAIAAKAVGDDHESIGMSMNNRASMLYALGRLGDALPVFESAARVLSTALGPDDTKVKTVEANLQGVRSQCGAVPRATGGATVEACCAYLDCDATESLRRCAACKNVAYCSANCQKLDWKAHKAECKSHQKRPNVTK